MKIVIGSESFPPAISGVATMAEFLATYYAKQGHEVVVFAPSKDATVQVEELNGYQIVRLASRPNPFRPGLRVTWQPKAEIYRRIDEFKPDIIHLHDPTSICTALMHAGRSHKIPVVITNHFRLDFIYSYLGPFKIFKPVLAPFIKWYIRHFYNQCSVVTCPSLMGGRDLVAWGVRVPVRNVTNGADLGRFGHHIDCSFIKEKFHLPDKPIVLYLGRMDLDKRIDVLLKAAQHVVKEVDAHFLMVGASSHFNKVKALAHALDLDDHVTWTGWQEGKAEEYPQFYHCAALFAIPSPIETQSIVTMEAMASGLPVVAADQGALCELVRDGENGYLFHSGDHDEMAEKIVEILSNESLRREMAQHSRDFMQHNTRESGAEEMLKIYYKLLEHR